MLGAVLQAASFAAAAARCVQPAARLRRQTVTRAEPISKFLRACKRQGGSRVAPPPPAAARGRRREACRLVAMAGGGQGPWGDKQQRRVDNQIFLGVALGLTLVVLAALKLGGGAFQSADVWGASADDLNFGVGDAAGGLLWALSLFYCSPIQLLLLFFGFIETERPSDWLLRALGQSAGLDRVPAALQAAVAAVFTASGLAIAATLQAALGDATWSVSTGLGACLAAGMYEVGRPARLSVEEAQEKEKAWQDFARFADARLQRSGRCHESEILRALQREMPQFRREGALDAGSMRQLVRNWQPDAERSSNGYWKNVSLRPGGGDAIAPAASAASLDASADQD